MGIRISNTDSIQAINSLTRINRDLSVSLRRLSTGLRIATAADDPAGLGVSERLRSQIRSLEQAKRNTSDAISLVETGEGALAETSDILTRLRELAVDAANGTTSDADKATLDSELQTLVGELNRIARASKYDAINLLDGSATTVRIQVGINTTTAVDTIDVTLSPALSTSLAIQSLNISSTGNASAAITAIDAAIVTVASLRGRLGAVQNRLGYALNSLSSQSASLSSAESNIRDVDVAVETAHLTRNQVLRDAALAILGQANLQARQALSLLKP